MSKNKNSFWFMRASKEVSKQAWSMITWDVRKNRKFSSLARSSLARALYARENIFVKAQDDPLFQFLLQFWVDRGRVWMCFTMWSREKILLLKRKFIFSSLKSRKNKNYFCHFRSSSGVSLMFFLSLSHLHT